jgi:hypothetical protein
MNNNIQASILSTDDYINIIELLKQALKFYANTNNYSVNRKVSDSIFSAIQMDSGVQARFAIEKIKALIEEKEKTVKYYNEIVKSSENLSEEEQIKLINKLITLKE